MLLNEQLRHCDFDVMLNVISLTLAAPVCEAALHLDLGNAGYCAQSMWPTDLGRRRFHKLLLIIDDCLAHDQVPMDVLQILPATRGAQRMLRAGCSPTCAVAGDGLYEDRWWLVHV